MITKESRYVDKVVDAYRNYVKFCIKNFDKFCEKHSFIECDEFNKYLDNNVTFYTKIDTDAPNIRFAVEILEIFGIEDALFNYESARYEIPSVECLCDFTYSDGIRSYNVYDIQEAIEEDCKKL